MVQGGKLYRNSPIINGINIFSVSGNYTVAV
jgi:hypothetical protein